MFWDPSREASPTNERSPLDSHPLVLRGIVSDQPLRTLQIKERSSCFVGFFSIERTVYIWVLIISTMAMKMKGIYKGFKCISQMFAVVKEREMEIGYPTDVKHVAHIGWEGSSGSAPSWMSEFKAGAELLSPRPSSFGNARNSSSFFSTCSSTDLDQASSQPTTTLETPRGIPPADLPNVHNAKKKNRKKKSSSTSTSSPRSKSSSRSSKSVLSKSSYKSSTSRSN